jgi:hypothetical protein
MVLDLEESQAAHRAEAVLPEVVNRTGRYRDARERPNGNAEDLSVVEGVWRDVLFFWLGRSRKPLACFAF